MGWEEKRGSLAEWLMFIPTVLLLSFLLLAFFEIQNSWMAEGIAFKVFIAPAFAGAMMTFLVFYFAPRFKTKLCWAWISVLAAVSLLAVAAAYFSIRKHGIGAMETSETLRDTATVLVNLASSAITLRVLSKRKRA